MSKEITYFVIDLAKSMASSYDDRQGANCQLDVGLNYFYHTMIQKIIKGRKTDYVSIITCHGPVTNNNFSDQPGFDGINVVCHKQVPTYSQLKHYKSVLVANDQSHDQQGDCVQAMLVAVAMMQADLKLKFIRNIVVITNGEDPVKSFGSEIVNASIQAINNNAINVLLLGINFHDDDDDDTKSQSSLKLQTQRAWKQLLANYHHHRFIDASKITDLLQFTPPLKRIKPIKSFAGNLKLGGDPRYLDITNDSMTLDDAPISFDVEVYPGARPEKLTNAHQYHIQSNGVVEKVKSETNHFITVDKRHEPHGDDDDNLDIDARGPSDPGTHEIEKINVDKNDIIHGFKYSNFDVLAMLEDLQKESILPVAKSMDIIGFMKANDIPVAYFTLESNYILPRDGKMNDFIAFSGFCEALIMSQAVVILRYVAKDVDIDNHHGSEVQICAGFPCKIKLDTNYIFALTMIRLPFREDEKMGRFPFLIPKPEFQTEDNTIFDDNPQHDDLMDQFIMSKDLDINNPYDANEDINQQFLHNKRVGLTSNEGLNLAPTFNDVDSKLLINSPALRKYDNNLIKIIKKSLDVDNMNDFLNDADFVGHHMVDSLTNLFNLENVLQRLELDDWLVKLNEISYGSGKHLAKIAKPFKPRKTRSTKHKNKFPGIYVRGATKGSVEVEDEDPFDDDLLLGL